MNIKTIVMLSVALVPFVFINLDVCNQYWQILVLYAFSAFGMAGVGMSVMHDAIHNSHSNNQLVNKALSYTLNIIGGNAEIWKLQHNVLHHTYTNIMDADEDIQAPFFLRFSPDAKHHWLHRYQHWYVWFFYGLSTLSWVISQDFFRLHKYKQMGLIKGKADYMKKITQIILWKIVYFSYVIVLPIYLTDFSTLQILGGFMLMHFIIGLVLTLIFQLAHIVPEANFPQPTKAGTIENNWTIHQLETTCNFSQKSKIMSWCIGGLNFQIEHHLFPNICHVHYKEIAKITRKTAEEFNIPYHTTKNFFTALQGHIVHLKKLGYA